MPVGVTPPSVSDRKPLKLLIVSSTYLYVTPLDERMRTLCLFFRSAPFAPFSSTSGLSPPLDLDNVL